MSDLTQADKELFIEVLETYPAGVDSGSWGYGPMETMDEAEDAESPERYSRYIRKKYG